MVSIDHEEQCNITKLNDITDFQLWKFQVTIYFKSFDLMDIVEGKWVLKLNDKKDQIKEWNKKDARAQKLIISTINKKPLMHLLNCKTSKEMFEKLCSIYERDHEQQKWTLLNEFFTFKFDNSIDIASHVSELENLAHKLRTLEKDIDDSMIMSKIIATLPDKYSHFISAWESTPQNDRTLTNLTSRLLAEEQRFKSTDNSVVAFKTISNKNDNNNNPSINSVRKSTQCFNCKGYGHIARNCKKKNTENKQDMFCSICRKTNHTEKQCYFRKNKQEKVSFLTADKIESKWIIDSGSTSHMMNDATFMKDIKEEKSEIIVAKKDESMTCKGIGTFETDSCTLKNVLYVPQLSRNLLSVNAITENGGKVIFEKDKVKIMKNECEVLEGQKGKSGLYTVDLNKKEKEETLLAENELKAIEWHEKLGHLGFKNLKRLLKLSTGINISEKEIDAVKNISCETCINAKQTRQPFNSVRARASRPIELIHTDVCGPIDPISWDGKKYFLTVMDDYTHYVEVYPIQSKAEVYDKIKDFIEEIEAKWNSRVSKIRCDNGGEYVSNLFKTYCRNKGIVIDYTIPYTPQLNGRAERLNRTILEKTRSLIFSSKLEKNMWNEAILMAAYLLNRSPTDAIDTTPIEKWTSRTPDLSKLQMFGTEVYAKIERKIGKLEPKSRKLIFIGYTLNGLRLWDPIKKAVTAARDVIFSKEGYNNSRKEIQVNKDIEVPEENNVKISGLNYSDEEQLTEENDPVEEQTECIERRQRIRKFPEKYKDYVLLTYEEATTGPEKEQWQRAIEEEKQSLIKNETWTEIDEEEAEGKEIISSKWIFKVKSDGRYKARLVARGFEQKREFSLEEIYSPVVNDTSLRLILEIAVHENYEMYKFDIKTAFLYGRLKEEIYMRLPNGFDNKICKLNKSLYGLKQAPICWNERFTQCLNDHGLHSCANDKCIYISEERDIILALYVDDGILTGRDKIKLLKLLEELKKNFELTYDSNIKNFLGMEILEVTEGIKLCQTRYSEGVLKRYKMDHSKGANTPISQLTEQSNETTDRVKFPYQECVGSLLYLTTKTRPDMAFAVNYESRFINEPISKNVCDIKRTLRYLKETTSKGIILKNTGEINKLVAYCDSDYANDEHTRKSVSGYVIMLCDSPISWCSRRQPIVAMSSTEAEYIAAAECCQQLIHIKRLLEELICDRVTATLRIDNQSTISLIKTGITNKRSKHIDVRYHYISEKAAEGSINIEYISSENQTADILTKPLGGVKFKQHSTTLVK